MEQVLSVLVFRSQYSLKYKQNGEVERVVKNDEIK